MTVAIISAGYDGTVDEVQFAKLLHRYSVVGADDFDATTQAGDRIVAFSNGTALGPGTLRDALLPLRDGRRRGPGHHPGRRTGN